MDSELIEFVRIAIKDGEMSAGEVAGAMGMSPQAFSEFLRNCKGTQIARVEQILDILGYEIVIRKRRQ